MGIYYCYTCDQRKDNDLSPISDNGMCQECAGSAAHTNKQHTDKATVVITCEKIDKARWCQAAYPAKLQDWVIKTLKKQADKDLKESTK